MSENPPAFACADGVDYQPGMSLRDFIAAHVLPAFALDALEIADVTDDDMMFAAAQTAYRVADAMLKARAIGGAA